MREPNPVADFDGPTFLTVVVPQDDHGAKPALFAKSYA
jgi:hypothetical protein